MPNRRAVRTDQQLSQLNAEAKAGRREFKQMAKTVQSVANLRKIAKQPRANPPKELSNPYLKAIVQPELYGAGVRYPDKFSRKTACMQALNTLEVPRTATAQGNTPAGSFSVVVRPSMEKPIWCLEQTAVVQPITVVVNTQQDFSGLFPSDPTIEHDNSDGLELVDSNWYNVVGPIQWNATNTETWMNRAQSAAGGFFFGMPGIDPTATGTNTNLTILFLRAMTGLTIGVRTINSTTTGTIVTVAGGAALTYTAILAAANVVLDPGLPGVGIQVRVTGGVVGVTRYPVASIAFDSVIRISAVRYAPTALVDESVLENVVDRQRTVSQSMWISYRGNIINGGGFLAGMLYGGGQPPGWVGFNNYASVASTPGSYAGKLQDGCYGFFKPSDETDMLMRNYDEAEKDWVRPFLIAFGQVSDLTQAIQLQLRVITNYEIVSTSQLFSYEYGPQAPWMIDHAGFSLREISSFMENPLHLASIGKFLAKVGRGALSVAKFAAETAPVWGPWAAAAIAL